MHLMADALGVGSCWLQVRLRQAADGRDTADVVRELLGIPTKFGVMAMLTLGLPASHPAARTVEELPFEKTHREHF
jgi:nitroreductase